MKKLTTEEFIERAKKVHGNKYDYSKVKYKDIFSKIKINCNICKNFFEQRPSDHLSGYGCPYCAKNVRRSNNDEFIKKAQKIHGNNFNYDKVEYINNRTKVKIKCNTCFKEFEQNPDKHLIGHGCPYCKGGIKKSREHFIKKAYLIHGNEKYDYTQVIYKNTHTKVKIKCNKCGKIFEQTPTNHLHGQNCPHCYKSRGEERIKKFLEENNIEYIFQKRFKDCKDKISLPFDFYIPDLNICIEFQGEQHYKPSLFINKAKSKAKGLELFEKQQYHDQIKRDYCKANNIQFIEIKYNENIEEKLKLLLLKK